MTASNAPERRPVHRWRRHIHLHAAAVVGAVLCVVAAILYVQIGVFNVAADIPHHSASFWVTHTMMVRAVKLRARGAGDPPPMTAAEVTAGFRIYDARCELCHGAPGVARPHWVNGITPGPPYLVGAAGRWTPKQLFWIVKHGVKMTAMPSWDLECSDAEIWQVVAFLEAMPRLRPEDYRAMKTAASRSPAPASACASPSSQVAAQAQP